MPFHRVMFVYDLNTPFRFLKTTGFHAFSRIPPVLRTTDFRGRRRQRDRRLGRCGGSKSAADGKASLGAKGTPAVAPNTTAAPQG